MIYYPSIGNLSYPYLPYYMLVPEYAFNLLEYTGEAYHMFCKVLRERYKWSPLHVDQIDLRRLFRIFNELSEEAENSNAENG